MSRFHRVPTVQLERFAIGEYPKRRLRRIKETIAEDEATLIENLHEQNREFFETHNVEEFDREIRARLKPRSASDFRMRPRFVYAGIAVAAAILLIIAIPTGILSNRSDIRTKGAEPSLAVYKSVGTDYVTLKDGEYVAAGDRVQLAYASGGFAFGAILSVDGNGVVTQHLPLVGNTAVPLDETGEILLPYSFVLDNAPDFERFYLIVSKKRFDLDSLLHSAHLFRLRCSTEAGR